MCRHMLEVTTILVTVTTTITHLLVSLQLPGVSEAPLVSGLRDPVVDEMKFVVRAKDWTEAVEAIPLGDVVGQNSWLGVPMVGVYFHIEVVCEDFFSVTGEDEGKEEDKGDLVNIFLTKTEEGRERRRRRFLISVERSPVGGGEEIVPRRSPPSVVATS